MKNENSIFGLGIVTAIAASLCCITPIVGLVAGIGGIASSFEWMKAYRPYLIGLTTLALGFGWFQKLKSRTPDEIACACEEDEKPSLTQSKKFLAGFTVLSILFIAFPYYSGDFISMESNKEIIIDSKNVTMADIQIKGMTCTGCSATLKSKLSAIVGVIDVTVDHEFGTGIIQYDKTRVTQEIIKKVIEKDIGYQLTNFQVRKGSNES